MSSEMMKNPEELMSRFHSSGKQGQHTCRLNLFRWRRAGIPRVGYGFSSSDCFASIVTVLVAVLPAEVIVTE